MEIEANMSHKGNQSPQALEKKMSTGIPNKCYIRKPRWKNTPTKDVVF